LHVFIIHKSHSESSQAVDQVCLPTTQPLAYSHRAFTADMSTSLLHLTQHIKTRRFNINSTYNFSIENSGGTEKINSWCDQWCYIHEWK